MANLPEETLKTVFSLQRQLFQIIHEATATNYDLTEQHGETATTLPELEELQNIKERARDSYNRLSRLLLIIGEAQPIASLSTLDLLYNSIDQAQVSLDALQASIQEIKRNWEL